MDPQQCFDEWLDSIVKERDKDVQREKAQEYNNWVKRGGFHAKSLAGHTVLQLSLYSTSAQLQRTEGTIFTMTYDPPPFKV